jgi:hypothetical protein
MVSLAADFLEPDLWRLCLKNAWAAGQAKNAASISLLIRSAS